MDKGKPFLIITLEKLYRHMVEDLNGLILVSINSLNGTIIIILLLLLLLKNN